MIKHSIWLEHPKYPGYRFSPEGGILSLKRSEPRMVSQNADKRSGILRCFLSYEFINVHRVIAEIYCEPSASTKWVVHLDGDRSNNDAKNLAFMSPMSNAAHCRDNRGHMGSRGVDRSPLSESDIKKIYRLRFDEKLTNRVIAQRFGLTEPHVRSICQGHTWRHIWLEAGMNIRLHNDSSERSVKRLSESDIIEIRRLITEEKVPYRELCRRFNTSPSMISKIRNQKIWKGI